MSTAAITFTVIGMVVCVGALGLTHYRLKLHERNVKVWIEESRAIYAAGRPTQQGVLGPDELNIPEAIMPESLGKLSIPVNKDDVIVG